MIILEIIGMLGSILGAILLSLSERKYVNKTFYAFLSFFVANFALVIFSAYKNMLFLYVQMIFFIITSYFVLISKHKDNIKDKINIIYLSLIFISISIGLFFIFYNNKLSIQDFNKYELIAAILAVVGSFIMKYRDYRILVFAFILFFIADILYVSIALDNGLNYFAIQSGFFVLTSLYGIYNIFNDMKINSENLTQKDLV